MPAFVIGILTVVHIVSCIALMISILLQSGKGGGLAGAFGGGSSQTLFGGRGAASFLSRASTALAIVFFVTSLTLGLSSSSNAAGRASLIQEEARRRASQRPVGTPGAPAAGAPGQPATGPATAGPASPGAPTTGPTTPVPAPAPTSPAPSSGN